MAMALLATDASTVYAATASGVYQSIDGGATFGPRFRAALTG